VNWIANFAVSLVFLPVVDAIGQGQTFWLFAIVCAFAIWFVGRYVPETSHRTFLEADADLQARWKGEAPPPAGRQPRHRQAPSSPQPAHRVQEHRHDISS
jgi:hypothetical protein